MRLFRAFVLVLSACDFPRPADVPGDAAPSLDAALPDGIVCYGSFVRVCFSVPPAMPVMLNENTDIDTDSSARCDQRNDQATTMCVVAGTTFALTNGKTLRGHGSKPLVLLATSTFELAGTIDVSSHHSGADAVGPGALRAESCTNQMFPTGNSGGFGGAFGGRGGPGEGVDGMGGVPERDPIGFPTTLRGGCAGANGSTTTAGVLAGAGGSGGGAVAIIAAEIRLNGTINASGAGARGGPALRSGGGGGGSGGMIMLDAPSIVPGPAFALFANGGGGAEGGAGFGAGGSRPGVGADGGESTGPTSAAPGGTLETDGGDGGEGSARCDRPGAAGGYRATADGGGGGGGGGAGYIHAPGLSGTNISPCPINP